MRKVKNEVHVEGYLYEHNLQIKKSGDNSKNPGTEFINGTISVATDNEMTNIIQIHFSYVVATTKNGQPNTTFNILKNILDGKINTVMGQGAANAGMIRVDSAIGLNEWYDKNDTLVSVKRNEGGFVHMVNNSALTNDCNSFRTDIVLTNANRIEADDEKGTPEKMILRGAIFNFRNELLPVEYTVYNPKAMDYFDNLEISQKNPVFTQVWGTQVSQTIVRKIEEESAWGDISVREVKSSQRDFVITGALVNPYEWDNEETILASEFAEMISNREIHLAEIKKARDEYQTKQKDSTTVTNIGGYNF